jgi:hypothetical protein
MTVKTQQFYYNLLLQGHMFRLLRVIIRPSNEPTQDYLIPSALWDPVALTMDCVNLQIIVCYYRLPMVTMFRVYKSTRYLVVVPVVVCLSYI